MVSPSFLLSHHRGIACGSWASQGPLQRSHRLCVNELTALKGQSFYSNHPSFSGTDVALPAAAGPVKGNKGFTDLCSQSDPAVLSLQLLRHQRGVACGGWGSLPAGKHCA
eukprot:1156961-Pelagomonas_calceolata.AAC.5